MRILVKIAPKRQVTFPDRVLNALGVRPGDQIELAEGPDGFALRPRQADPTHLVPSQARRRKRTGRRRGAVMGIPC